MSGAQLSNYATFLVHPEQAPLSIVLTALSTAAGVFMTPVLALLLLGARIPVDARGMALSITQIVLVPVLAGDSSSHTCGSSVNQFSLSRERTKEYGFLEDSQLVLLQVSSLPALQCCPVPGVTYIAKPRESNTPQHQ